MAYFITDLCVNCFACMDVCPNEAITEGQQVFVIDAKRCTGCEGAYAAPQCASICPVEGAILDPSGLAANPPGSLTGIPPERWAGFVAAGMA
jgi:ferredoxin